MTDDGWKTAFENGIDAAMGELHETAASLRFFADDLDPDEITRRLGGAPSVGVRKGGIWLTSRGVEKIASTGQWRVTAERRIPGDLDAQVAELLSPLTTDLVVWNELTRRFKADVFCGLFVNGTNEGLSLSPETLEALGSRGLVLGLDIYCPDGET
jgi:hypothetical protein